MCKHEIVRMVVKIGRVTAVVFRFTLSTPTGKHRSFSCRMVAKEAAFHLDRSANTCKIGNGMKNKQG